MDKRFYIIGILEKNGIKPYYSAGYELRKRGYLYYNPIAFIFNTLDREGYFKDNLRKMIGCNAILLLPGWEESRYSQTEFYMAGEMKLPVYAFIEGKLKLLKEER